LVVELANRPAQEIADELLRSTARHERGADNVQDDRTVVVLKVL
jgi:serine phosphatase RsbU (regulator of sigma subunit)